MDQCKFEWMNARRSDGLLAFWCAMQLDWDQGGDKRRHTIVIFDDTDCLDVYNYAGEEVPIRIDELFDLWEDANMEKSFTDSSKRLLLFAPDNGIWSKMGMNLSNAIHFPQKAGVGLSEIDYNTILDSLVCAI